MGISTAGSAAELQKILKKRMENTLRKSSSGILEDLKKIIEKQLKVSPTVISLTSDTGDLRRDFGLSQAKGISAVKFIINAINSNLKVEVISNDSGARVKVQMIITILAIDVDSLLESGSAAYISRQSGELITWLKWLLSAGTQVVVDGFHVVEGEGLGRSGLGHMQKTGVFRVEPKHAGTPNNNFITKAIIAGKEDIKESLIKRFRSNI